MSYKVKSDPYYAQILEKVLTDKKRVVIKFPKPVKARQGRIDLYGERKILGKYNPEAAESITISINLLHPCDVIVKLKDKRPPVFVEESNGTRKSFSLEDRSGVIKDMISDGLIESDVERILELTDVERETFFPRSENNH